MKALQIILESLFDDKLGIEDSPIATAISEIKNMNFAIERKSMVARTNSNNDLFKMFEIAQNNQSIYNEDGTIVKKFSKDQDKYYAVITRGDYYDDYDLKIGKGSYEGSKPLLNMYASITMYSKEEDLNSDLTCYLYKGSEYLLSPPMKQYTIIELNNKTIEKINNALPQEYNLPKIENNQNSQSSADDILINFANSLKNNDRDKSGSLKYIYKGLDNVSLFKQAGLKKLPNSAGKQEPDSPILFYIYYGGYGTYQSSNIFGSQKRARDYYDIIGFYFPKSYGRKLGGKMIYVLYDHQFNSVAPTNIKDWKQLPNIKRQSYYEIPDDLAQKIAKILETGNYD